LPDQGRAQTLVATSDGSTITTGTYAQSVNVAVIAKALNFE